MYHRLRSAFVFTKELPITTKKNSTINLQVLHPTSDNFTLRYVSAAYVDHRSVLSTLDFKHARMARFLPFHLRKENNYIVRSFIGYTGRRPQKPTVHTGF